MEDDRYNGWANYATWRINLEICDDITSSLIGEQTFPSVEDLAEYLKDEVDDILTNYGELEGLAVDYARAFVADVDWREIAGHADELIADNSGWDGVEPCYVCGKIHDPADCGLCDTCGDYHPGECAP